MTNKGLFNYIYSESKMEFLTGAHVLSFYVAMGKQTAAVKGSGGLPH